MTEEEFRKYAEQGYNRIPVVASTLADLETPLSLYLKLAAKQWSYMLESVDGGERSGRYSFIGLPCSTRIEVRGKHLQILHGDTVQEEEHCDDVFATLRKYLARFRTCVRPEIPRSCAGFVGYFGYNTVRFIEPRLARARPKNAQQTASGMPDILLLQSEEIAIVDNVQRKLILAVFANPNEPHAWEHAQNRLKSLLEQLAHPIAIPVHIPPKKSTSNDGTDTVSSPDAAGFKAAVRRAKQYIFDGDLMQVVLSQRLTRSLAAHPFTLYRALRSLNPSPYMFYFDFGSTHIVGASPEILVRLRANTVTLRPIAGTRPRGKNLAEDLALAEDLLADPKERAEHLQLLDLGRNDVGRVAKTGTVRVTESFQIERYSHVMHIASNVEGELHTGEDALSVLRAAFPAGTVSGAPKVRAMELIDELEPTNRGIYSGAVGYLTFDGDMDLAIAIRTAVLHKGLIEVQAGAGIVADSDPDTEWLETQNKARAMLRAAELAERGLNTTDKF